ILAVEQDIALAQGEAAGDQVEQRRLAGAVRSDDGVALALGDVQGDAADDRRDAEILVDVPERKRGHRTSPAVSAPAGGCAASAKASASLGPQRRPSRMAPPISRTAASQGRTLFELKGK